MPSAETFDFIHAGNGIHGHISGEPCLLARDVSNDPYWCTLSGYSHLDTGDVTSEQIRESEARLYDLYYRVATLRCKSVRVRSSGTTETGEDVSFIGSEGEQDSQPYMRTCGGDTTTGTIDNSPTVARAIDIRPVKLYTGDISDESNFVGYGVTAPDLEDTVANTAFRINDQFNQSGVYLNSFFDSVIHRFQDVIDHEVVNINGFSLVCRARINNDTFTQQSNEVADAANLIASTNINNFGSRSSISMQITGVELYDLV